MPFIYSFIIDSVKLFRNEPLWDCVSINSDKSNDTTGLLKSDQTFGESCLSTEFPARNHVNIHDSLAENK